MAEAEWLRIETDSPVSIVAKTCWKILLVHYWLTVYARVIYEDSKVFYQSRKHALSSGLTIIEVMISMAVLAVGISAILSHMFTLKSVRDASRDAAIIENLVNEMVERFTGARWEVLGTPAVGWSIHRPYSVSAIGNPLTDLNDGSANSLVTMGILRQSTGMKNLKVYVDYYRGMTEYDSAGLPIAGKLGLMDGEGTTFNNLSDLKSIWFNESALAPYLLDASQVPTSQVPVDRPLVIRIVISSADLVRPLVFFTGRKQ